jgi:hypothetical protein
MPLKKALVIGNDEYTSLQSLPLCANDRIEVARVLETNFKFEVTTKPNCGYLGLREALQVFITAYRQDQRRSEHGGDVVCY